MQIMFSLLEIKYKTLKILNETSNLYPRNLMIKSLKKSISQSTIDLQD